MGEQEVFREDFNLKLGSGWSWIREDSNAWRISDQCLMIDTLSGGMWTDSQLPPRNILLRALHDPTRVGLELETCPSTHAAEVTVRLRPETWGISALLLFRKTVFEKLTFENKYRSCRRTSWVSAVLLR
jgi:hypothetical protein